ncbi:MAG: hypothetical protein JWP97_3649 [Labilithrix sp.]|nr:hypothetical protein [Labilithrix sp.]
MRRALVWTVVLPLALAAATYLPACSSSDDEAGDVDTSPIAWVSPTADASIEVGEAVELTVKVNDPSAAAVRFELNGKTLATCDTSKGADECRRGDLFRTTTTFTQAGSQRLVARVLGADTEVASLTITVRAAGEPGGEPPSDAGVDASTKDSGTTGGTPPPPPASRGFLDPDRAAHNVFGGVSWSVKDNNVGVSAAPSGSVSAVAACMKAYGASIRKWADTYKISRGSVVATAITESNCSNPAGSSDGLSSGPLQVTGSTCASVVSGYSASACKTKMHSSPDFSFQVGSKYMAGSYQIGQSGHDPPKMAAAYNAGSIRSTTANRWHMVVTGNHIERWVGAYDAYRAWEKLPPAAQAALENEDAVAAARIFDGEHVTSPAALPANAVDGQVYFVGDWSTRDGTFVHFRDGAWREE